MYLIFRYFFLATGGTNTVWGRAPICVYIIKQELYKHPVQEHAFVLTFQDVGKSRDTIQSKQYMPPNFLSIP